MRSEPISVAVDAEAAQAFRSASAETRRKLGTLVGIWILEATRTKESLREVMLDTSRKARQRGLTPQILKAALDAPSEIRL
jgi:hypothetical protein